MKLNEALAERKDLAKRIKSLTARLGENVRTLDGQAPEEEPVDLKKQIQTTLAEQESLVLRINLTNVAAVVGETGLTITRAIARRDRLTQEIGILGEIIASGRRRGLYGDERTAKYEVHLSIRHLQEEVDDLSKQLRELDNAIQRANFEVDLVELPAA